MGALREDRLGRYELLIELGRGGMAELFLGRLHGAGGFAKLVALKRILPHLAQDAQFKEMFLNEGRIAAQLSHPNVCQVFELEETDAGDLFLAMEYLDGVSWEHLAAALPRGPHALWLTAGVLGQAAEGLHYAHTLRDIEGNPTPVVHRDVSPQNLFVTVDGVCKVLDFGVSKIMTDGPRTRTGVIKGKLPYMAPEQIRGDAIDGRADVFSLGVCAWEALAGTRLFDRSTDFAIWKAITEEPIPPLAQYWPECPRDVELIVRRALERDREQRQGSARMFADELRAAAGGHAALADIAQAVRTQCGDRIAARQRQVATAVSSRKLDAAATLRDASVIPEEAAGETLELRNRSARVVRDQAREDRRDVPRDEDDAAATRDLRRDSASTVDQLPSAAPPAPKRRVGLLIAVALIAAAAAAGIVAVVMSKQQEPPTAAPPPVAEPAPAPTPAPEPAPVIVPIDAGTAVVEASPPIDAGASKTAKKKQPVRPAQPTSTETAATPTPPPDETPADEVDPNDPVGSLRKGAEDLKKAAEELKKLEKLRELGGN